MENETLTSLLSNLSPTQIKTVYYLANGFSKTDTAKKIGVTTKTIHNWGNSTVFNNAVTILTISFADEQVRKEVLKKCA